MTSCFSLLLLFSGCVLFTCTSAQNSCKGRCGEDYVRSPNCNCDYECLLHSECCKDYESICTTGGSCKGRCGETFKRGRKCQCDKDCNKYLQCCPDYKNYCNIQEVVSGSEPLSDDTFKTEPTKTINMSPEPEKQNGSPSKEPSASVPSSTNSLVLTTTSQPSRDTAGINSSPGPEENPTGPQASTILPEISSTKMVITQQPSEQPATTMPASEENEFNSETKPPSTTVPENTLSSHNSEMTSPDLTDKPEPASTIPPAIIPTTTIPTKPSEQTDQNPETNPQSPSEPEPTPSTNAQANNFENDLTTEHSVPEQTDQNPETNPQSTSELEPTPFTNAQANNFDNNDSTTEHSDPEQTDQNAETNPPSTSEPEPTPSTNAEANNFEDNDSTTEHSVPEQTDQNPETNPQSTSEPEPTPSTNAQANNFEDNDSTTEYSDPEQTDQNAETNPQSTSEPEPTPSTNAQANGPENTNPTNPEVIQDPENKPESDKNPPSGEGDQNTTPADKPNGDDFPSTVNDSNTSASVEENSPTTSDIDDNNYQADENYDTNLCSGRPINGLTTLRNGTIVVFRGHYFWILDDKRKPGPAQLIKDVWGIPSPIDTVYTRCNCQGKTYFFKGNDYWRFENDVMDSGFPKPVSEGFGLKDRVIAALSIPQHRRRRESVLFFKKGGLAQRYTYQVTPSCDSKPAVYLLKRRFQRAADSELGLEINIKIWRGFPSTVTSAVSVPATGGDGYSYYVFSPTKYYSLNVEGDTPAIIPPKGGPEKQKSAKSWFGCPEANIV
ncbi:proteoglycan 4b [Trichomycterus rosablanca]|uniref:proteoglycan 4b n=1 Tax=Trichomycterus rosablanca TaxID=2290929 RepID=UPI002F34FBD4